jgi:hypothetical protein
MSEEQKLKAFNDDRDASLFRHYSTNTFFCGENTCLTLFRENKVVTYAHGRNLKVGDDVKIHRAVKTKASDDFVVKVIQIHALYDFIIMEGNENMWVSSPAFLLAGSGPCVQVIFGAEGLSLKNMVLRPFTCGTGIFRKAVSEDKPLGCLEGAGFYQNHSSALWGICVGCKCTSVQTLETVDVQYEYDLVASGMFF